MTSARRIAPVGSCCRAASENPLWLELSFQYWCRLLEHLEHLASVHDHNEDMQLLDVKRILEWRVGLRLVDVDEYLLEYKFGPDMLLAIVGLYTEEGKPNSLSFKEIVRKRIGSCGLTRRRCPLIRKPLSRSSRYFQARLGNRMTRCLEQW